MSRSGIGRQGELRTAFALRGNETTLVENYCCPPLQVMRAIRDAAGCLCIYLLSPTGGVVQGDHYSIHIQAGEGTHALVTTQSATKVYRMPDGCAEQDIRIEVLANAVFEFVPDALILFADADYRQNMDVILHPGALAVIYEIVLPGRVAHGEYLEFRRYASRIRVRDTTGLILYDAADIHGQDAGLSETGALEGYTCWGSAWIVGDLERYQIDPAVFCETHRGLFEQEAAIGGLTPLYRNGICARMLSTRLEMIYHTFHELRAVIRTRYLGLPSSPLRK